jgi:hypothetical protein
LLVKKKVNEEMKMLGKRILMLMFGIVMMFSFVNATIEMDYIHFDPAIIASGDEVDIVVQYHHESIAIENDYVANPDYKYKVMLETDDEITEKFVIIQDSLGDDLAGHIYADGVYNKKFRVKVLNDAPAGSYEFKLSGGWIKDGEYVGPQSYERFKMDVKKEGIVLNVASYETIPSEVRPGDNYVNIKAKLENAGEKFVKSVEVNLGFENVGLEHSYTNKNRVYVGKINPGETKEIDLYLNVNKEIKSGEYSIDYSLNYMDEDNNEYSKDVSLPFLVKSKPRLEIVDVKSDAIAGDSFKYYVTVKNVGDESAEAVDIRFIKQNLQPFELDVRTDYLGELEVGEEAIAVFDIKVNSDAKIKSYVTKFVLRAKGDSDLGDDNIYSFSRKGEIDVVLVKKNNFVLYGLVLGVLLVVGLIAKTVLGAKK